MDRPSSGTAIELKAPIPLSIYVHIPWCIRKCPYCDFNSHAAQPDLPETQYLDAIVRDLEQKLPLIWGRRIDSIFIGGGTPSLFSAAAIERLLSELRQRLPLRPDLEITLEANPGTFEANKFRGFREAGINRLSIGIQSFNDRHLQSLGRIHGAAEAIAAVAIARSAGFDNLNLDLMFGLPGQSTAEACADLATAIALQPEHISFYQLTIEPNTAFHNAPPAVPDDDLVAAMQQQGQSLLHQAGYLQYEVSAYARSGRQCRHNLNYWEFGDYLALGAGAHGKLSDHASGHITRHWNVRQPALYLQAVDAGDAISGRQLLPAAALPFEFMLNALRLKQGVETPLFAERTGLPVEEIADILQLARQRGLLQCDTERLVASQLGYQYLNELLILFMGRTNAD